MMDRLDSLLFTRNGGNVARYHTCRIRPQSVAEHSYGVAQIILHVRSQRGFRMNFLLEAALNHDVYEYLTGDVSYMAKQAYPQLRSALDAAEADIQKDVNLIPLLLTEDEALLHWADMAEAILYCLEQVKGGNSYAQEVVINGCHAIKGLTRELCPTDQESVTALLLYISTEMEPL